MIPGMVIGIIWERGEWWCGTRNGDREDGGGTKGEKKGGGRGTGREVGEV